MGVRTASQMKASGMAASLGFCGFIAQIRDDATPTAIALARQKSETWVRRGPFAASLPRQRRQQREAPASGRFNMEFRLSIRRAILLAGTLGTLAVYPAAAQQQAPAAAPLNPQPLPPAATQAPAAAPLPPRPPLPPRLAADRPAEHRSRDEARAGRAAADPVEPGQARAGSRQAEAAEGL